MSDKVQDNRRQSSIRFNENDIKLIVNTMDILEKPIKFIYHLMGQDRERSFVLLFISGNGDELGNILRTEKRDTDLLYQLDENRNLFAFICQETKIDGGFRFAERLLDSLKANNVNTIYCSEMEVRSSKYPIHEVIFKGIENYKKVEFNETDSEIEFYSLS